MPKRKLLEQNQRLGQIKPLERRKMRITRKKPDLMKSYYNEKGKFVYVLDSGERNLNAGPIYLDSV